MEDFRNDRFLINNDMNILLIEMNAFSFLYIRRIEIENALTTFFIILSRRHQVKRNEIDKQRTIILFSHASFGRQNIDMIKKIRSTISLFDQGCEMQIDRDYTRKLFSLPFDDIPYFLYPVHDYASNHISCVLL